MWKFRALVIGIGIIVALSLTKSVPAQPGDILDADLTVTFTPLITPAVTNGAGASNVQDTSARLNGEITDTGNEDPTVTVFYGTSDGGTDPGSWSNNASVGVCGLGTFYEDVSSLSTETLYFYRMRAVNAAGTDWADSSANFTTTSTPLQPPSSVNVTFLGFRTINIAWDKAAGANNTLVMGSIEGYPTSNSTYELVFFDTGSSVNITGIPDLTINTAYFSLWSEVGGVYSADYATGEIGGEELEVTLTDATISLTGFQTYVFFFIEILVVIAFVYATLKWKEEIFMWVCTGLIQMFVAFDVWDTALGFSIVLLALGCYFLGMAAWRAFPGRNR